MESGTEGLTRSFTRTWEARLSVVTKNLDDCIQLNIYMMSAK